VTISKKEKSVAK